MRIPKKYVGEVMKTPTNCLWDILTSERCHQGSEAPLAAFPLRYAVYLYYRSRGWIVRPALSLGGADYLLYAESPRLRHAAYAVIVAPASKPPLLRDITAHLRVVASVAKVGPTLFHYFF